MVIEKLVYKNFLKYTLLISFLYMPIFGHLDALPLRIWDEARLAINAYEMYHNGNLIVTYYDGTPDMWNTKPPLLIWIQTLLMKIFGINVIAVRLPSAIAGFLTCVALVIFSSQFLKSFWFGFITSMVLITSNGYIDMHGTRTGDYDAPLTFFTTLGALFCFIYIETKKNKYLYFFLLSFLLAILTKGIAGLLFMPAIVIYIFIKKEQIHFLKNKHFYLGILVFAIIISGYYLLREKYTPGYLDAVWQNELGGRYLQPLEGNEHDFLYYYENLIHWQFTEWYLLIPCGFVIGLFIKNYFRFRNIILFSSLIIITYIIIISLSETKLNWYNLPIFPFLAIVVAGFLYFIFELIDSETKIKNYFKRNILPFIFLFLVFISPYTKIINKTYLPEELEHEKDFYEIGNYLKDATKGKLNLNGYKIPYKDYNAHIKFYILMLNDRGVDISLNDWTQLQTNDKVVASQDQIKEYIENHYLYDIIGGRSNVVEYLIKGKKLN